MVLEISVLYCSALLFWVCGDIVHHGGNSWQRRMLISWNQGIKEGNRKGLGVKDMPPVT
jgi:hypothetical protein